MNRPIRVLIVDDSTVIRRLLTEALSGDREIEIAGTAANGKIALAKVPQLNPDVITLDMEMPEMDGMTTLVELKRMYPKIPVIMFSALTQLGAEATFNALAQGASDYVTKPANVGSVTEAIGSVRKQLTPKLKALCPWYANATASKMSSSAFRPKRTSTRTQEAAGSQMDIMAVGVSTGGPSALASVLQQLPSTFPVPIVIVQHMPPVFTTYLAKRLDQVCQISVHEASHGDVLEPGGAWLAPGGHHMALRSDRSTIRIELHQEPPENSCRPAVDVLFRSVSEVYGSSAFATVMTGMGHDGLLGCRMIRNRGGRVIVQDQSTSVVWGMPGAVAQANLADRILPLEAIAQEWILETQRKPVHAYTSTRRET